MEITFRNVLSPARIPPPIQVVYFRSAGAEIRIFMSSTANRLISRINRSGKFLHSVDPPDRTMLRYNDFRRSRSVRMMASWTIWCTPGYSRPMSSGSKRISGARKRSCPIYRKSQIVLPTSGCPPHTLILCPSGRT